MSEQMQLPEHIKLLRILIVDDDSFMLELVEVMLRALGCNEVLQATDGARALEILDVQPVHLLICDLNMPGMDGIEFFRHLAQRSFDGWMIISSGSDTRLLNTVSSLVQAHQLRLLGSLHKPIAQSHLLAMLIKLAEAIPDIRAHHGIQRLSVDEIREGIKAGYVEVFFQPQISVLDGRVTGAESLVRWRHPTKGLIPPVAFISVAEDHGLIDSLTMVIFREAMFYHGEWTRQGHKLKISVNVSMDNLDQLDLPEQFAKIANQAGVDIRNVMLEMTESHLMSNLTASLEVITRLSLMGFKLSIDDFGTGYSSMEKLKQLPFDELKVDRAFVFGAAGDAAARAILDLSIRMGRAQEMQIVAEGVETQEDLAMVVAAGCDEVQGYLIAKPMSAEDFIPWKLYWENHQRKAWLAGDFSQLT